MDRLLCRIFGHKYINVAGNYGKIKYLGCIRCRRLYDYEEKLKSHVTIGVACWKDRKHPVQSGKIKSLKPWPPRLKPGLHGGLMVLHTNTSAKNPFLKENQDKSVNDTK